MWFNKSIVIINVTLQFLVYIDRWMLRNYIKRCDETALFNHLANGERKHPALFKQDFRYVNLINFEECNHPK